MLWIGLFIIACIIIIFFFARLHSIKKEMKKMAQQLQDYNTEKTNKKIDMSLFEENLENLGIEINRLMDKHTKEKRERIHFEGELKQTIANMSHDLRTPLTSILGYIQMAESDDLLERERKEYLTIAKKRAQRLEILLSDFFELSVIESSEYQLKTEKINLKNVTVDVLMSYYDRFNEKKIEPTISMPDEDIVIETDRSAVIRVIENLVTNAINHSDGEITIVLEEKDSTARLIVKNTASSLTDHDVEQLFNRFYVADKSRTEKSTGLGLSIVKSFMKKMEGTIYSELKDGQFSIVCEWRTLNNNKKELGQ